MPAPTKRALPPAAVTASATAQPRPASRPCTIISAPCRPSSSAAARPIPEVAPVTRALRPSRSRWPFITGTFISDPFAVVSCGYRAEQGRGRGIRNLTAHCGCQRVRCDGSGAPLHFAALLHVLGLFRVVGLVHAVSLLHVVGFLHVVGLVHAAGLHSCSCHVNNSVLIPRWIAVIETPASITSCAVRMSAGIRYVTAFGRARRR